MKKTVLFYFFSLILFSGSWAQTTISDSNKPELSNASSRDKKSGQIMVIPFEPKMYMSQIDHRIHEETKMDQKKIIQSIRTGLCDQLERKLSANFVVVNLMRDSIHTKKDLEAIYKNIAYRFVPVPDQNNYKAPVDPKKTSGIKNGQLMVETDNSKRYMDVKVINPKLIPDNYIKYKTNLFLFISQIDILPSLPSPTDMYAPPTRTLTVHYSVYTVDAKEINSGISETKFPNTINQPDKISSLYFSKIAEEIAGRITKANHSK
jgi:hypothetical protein